MNQTTREHAETIPRDSILQLSERGRAVLERQGNKLDNAIANLRETGQMRIFASHYLAYLSESYGGVAASATGEIAKGEVKTIVRRIYKRSPKLQGILENRWKFLFDEAVTNIMHNGYDLEAVENPTEDTSLSYGFSFIGELVLESGGRIVEPLVHRALSAKDPIEEAKKLLQYYISFLIETRKLEPEQAIIQARNNILAVTKIQNQDPKVVETWTEALTHYIQPPAVEVEHRQHQTSQRVRRAIA